jgi:uncharacterized membrane protein YfcA
MPVSSLAMIAILASGIAVGIGASFSGLGGGFLMMPILLFLGFSAPKHRRRWGPLFSAF